MKNNIIKFVKLVNGQLPKRIKHNGIIYILKYKSISNNEFKIEYCSENNYNEKLLSKKYDIGLGENYSTIEDIVDDFINSVTKFNYTIVDINKYDKLESDLKHLLMTHSKNIHIRVKPKIMSKYLIKCIDKFNDIISEYEEDKIKDKF